MTLSKEISFCDDRVVGNKWIPKIRWFYLGQFFWILMHWIFGSVGGRVHSLPPRDIEWIFNVVKASEKKYKMQSKREKIRLYERYKISPLEGLCNVEMLSLLAYEAFTCLRCSESKGFKAICGEVVDDKDSHEVRSERWAKGRRRIILAALFCLNPRLGSSMLTMSSTRVFIKRYRSRNSTSLRSTVGFHLFAKTRLCKHGSCSTRGDIIELDATRPAHSLKIMKVNHHHRRKISISS